MSSLDIFLETIKSEFDDDRLTYQKGLPTFHPENGQEAASLFKLANKQKQQLFIAGFGNYILPEGEKFNNILVVKTDRLNQYVQIVKDDYYIKIGAGFPLSEINTRLQESKLWLPHASLPFVGSVGGAVAGGLNSMYETHELPLKKYLIKAEIVTPEGEIIEPGSVSFKSVSGYDIVKVYCGSWGLLGMVVSATFRIMPTEGSEEYKAITMQKLSRENLVASLDEKNTTNDSMYSKKIKAKFDPNNILPVLE